MKQYAVSWAELQPAKPTSFILKVVLALGSLWLVMVAESVMLNAL